MRGDFNETEPLLTWRERLVVALAAIALGVVIGFVGGGK